MMRIFGFLFGLLLLALVFAGSVPRSLKDAFKSVLAPAAYHRPGPGVSLPAVPKEVYSELGSKAVPAGKGASGAVDPESEQSSHRPLSLCSGSVQALSTRIFSSRTSRASANSGLGGPGTHAGHEWLRHER